VADQNEARLREELEGVLWKARRREILERLDFFDGGVGNRDQEREERLRLEREVEAAKSRRSPGI